MKMFRRGVAILSLLFVAARAGDSSSDPYANETKSERDVRMAWWREARFGMFIHWGVYSVPAGTHNGRRVGGIGEWIMNRARIPVAEYRDYAKQFNPEKYDPEKWVELAKGAGMRYIVITAKHHDGFTLYPSTATNWGVGSTPYGKDLLKPLAEACRKKGIKLGFFYSQAQDWSNGGSASGGKWDAAQNQSMDEYIDRVAVPQVKELLTNYGEFPSVMWWDTAIDMNPDRAAKLIALLKLKPGIIHNNRLGGGFKGDTETPEQNIPATGFTNRDWETCMTINDTWGYKSYDNNWKSAEELIRNLVDIASKGGNYLLNVGPKADGDLPEPTIDRLLSIGNWMSANGASIHGTTASPFTNLAWGRCTKKIRADGGTLYFHVFKWPSDRRLVVPGLKTKIAAAKLLVTGENLYLEHGDNGATIELPPAKPDAIDSVIAADFTGELLVTDLAAVIGSEK